MKKYCALRPRPPLSAPGCALRSTIRLRVFGIEGELVGLHKQANPAEAGFGALIFWVYWLRE